MLTPSIPWTALLEHTSFMLFYPSAYDLTVKSLNVPSCTVICEGTLLNIVHRIGYIFNFNYAVVIRDAVG